MLPTQAATLSAMRHRPVTGARQTVHRGPIDLPSDYQARAVASAELQLEKAGVRLAWVLNQALGS